MATSDERARAAGAAVLREERDERGVVTLTMDRPGSRNAFDGRLIAALEEAAGRLGSDPGVRAIVLTGAGGTFSAGADVVWMREVSALPHDEDVAEQARMSAMYRALYDLPRPLIGRVEGYAFGGGCGLAAVCDVVVATDDARFALSEARLGLAPAIISPFVVRKIGASASRELFIRAASFDAARALAIGLVHRVVSAAELHAAVDEVVDDCLHAGPEAVATLKALVEAGSAPLDEAQAPLAETIVGLRRSPEGQEGTAAFREKRRPAWWPPAPPV